jgi:hypothetical protein
MKPTVVLAASLGWLVSSAAAAEKPAWVSPSRCLSPCTYAPAELVRIDADGHLDPAGPLRLDARAQPALEAWLHAAGRAGHHVEAASAYRSYEEQADTFLQTIDVGRAARPGHSEHQLGTTVDFRYQGAAVERWLARTAAHFGFAQSYPPGQERTTGYRAEPWHFRFVGPALAARARGRSLEALWAAQPELTAPGGSCASCPSPLSRQGCDGVDGAGRCDGTVLSWCFEGTLVRLDCVSSAQRCGVTGGLAACQVRRN